MPRPATVRPSRVYWSGISVKLFPKEDDPMDKYVCVCGYEYDPAVGDPDGGIAPGTPWEDIPDTWVCPVCGLGKDAFTKA